jgi:hypothetical protein
MVLRGIWEIFVRGSSRTVTAGFIPVSPGVDARRTEVATSERD